MQYAETLPLDDHEVVLTFDDGPLPRNSNQILEILAAQCVKATFFTVGRMAQANPEGVRKLRDAGHTIGTHTQSHPLGMNRMSVERARQEIDDGMASVKAALGDEAAPAPFFRIPGLARAEGIEEYLAAQGVQIWSADFPADDWRHVSPSRVYDLAVKRLEDKGRGILLLHDIQARTVTALPRILQELKAKGYRIVHVVPATAEQPATPTEPQQWQLHPPSENVAISRWPRIPNFVFGEADPLPAPALPGLDWRDAEFLTLAEPVDRARRFVHGIPLPQEAPWPRQLDMPSPLPSDNIADTLPAPAQSIFEIKDRPRPTAVAFSALRAEQTAPSAYEKGDAAKPAAADTVESRHNFRGKRRLAQDAGRSKRASASHHGGRASRTAGSARRGGLKHLVQVKKRSV